MDSRHLSEAISTKPAVYLYILTTYIHKVPFFIFSLTTRKEFIVTVQLIMINTVLIDFNNNWVVALHQYSHNELEESYFQRKNNLSICVVMVVIVPVPSSAFTHYIIFILFVTGT